MTSPLSHSAGLLTLCLAGAATAQNLYSQSMTYPNGRMVINLKLRNGPASAAITVVVTRISPVTGGVDATAPASFTTDAAGYGSFHLVMQASGPDCAPNRFMVDLNQGATTIASKEYLLE